MIYQVIEGSDQVQLGSTDHDAPDVVILCAGQMIFGKERVCAPIAILRLFEEAQFEDAKALIVKNLPLPNHSVAPDELTLQLVCDAFFAEHASEGYRQAVLKVAQHRVQDALPTYLSDDHSKTIADRALLLMASSLDQPLSMSDVAAELQCSAASLRASFRKAGYRSPNRELTRMRLEQACQLLAENELSISQVARAVGYKSVAALTHFFYKQMQCSPSAYRDRCLWVA